MNGLLAMGDSWEKLAVTVLLAAVVVAVLFAGPTKPYQPPRGFFSPVGVASVRSTFFQVDGGWRPWAKPVLFGLCILTALLVWL